MGIKTPFGSISIVKTPFGSLITSGSGSDNGLYKPLSAIITKINKMLELCSTGDFIEASKILTDTAYEMYIKQLNNIKKNAGIYKDYENIRQSTVKGLSGLYEAMKLKRNCMDLQSRFDILNTKLQLYVNLSEIVNSISGLLILFVNGNFTQLANTFTDPIYESYITQLNELTQLTTEYPDFEVIRSSTLLTLEVLKEGIFQYNTSQEYYIELIKLINNGGVEEDIYIPLSNFVLTVKTISKAYYTGDFFTANTLLTQSKYETLSTELAAIKLNATLYPHYENIRTFITQGLSGLYQAIQQYNTLQYTNNELEVAIQKASILNNMTELRKYVEGLSGSTGLFADVTMTSIAATIKPEYAEYIKLYGYPPGGIFEMDKLAIALANTIPP